MTADERPGAGRREWIGLAVIALPCLLYSMDLTVLELAVPVMALLLALGPALLSEFRDPEAGRLPGPPGRPPGTAAAGVNP